MEFKIKNNNVYAYIDDNGRVKLYIVFGNKARTIDEFEKGEDGVKVTPIYENFIAREYEKIIESKAEIQKQILDSAIVRGKKTINKEEIEYLLKKSDEIFDKKTQKLLDKYKKLLKIDSIKISKDKHGKINVNYDAKIKNPFYEMFHIERDKNLDYKSDNAYSIDGLLACKIRYLIEGDFDKQILKVRSTGRIPEKGDPSERTLLKHMFGWPEFFHMPRVFKSIESLRKTELDLQNAYNKQQERIKYLITNKRNNIANMEMSKENANKVKSYTKEIIK